MDVRVDIEIHLSTHAHMTRHHYGRRGWRKVGKKKALCKRGQHEELLRAAHWYSVSRPRGLRSKHETHNEDIRISNYRAAEIMGIAGTTSKDFQETPRSWQKEAHSLKVEVTLMGRWFWQCFISRVISFWASAPEVSSPHWRLIRLFWSWWGKTICCPKDLTTVSKVNDPKGPELPPPLIS